MSVEPPALRCEVDYETDDETVAGGVVDEHYRDLHEEAKRIAAGAEARRDESVRMLRERQAAHKGSLNGHAPERPAAGWSHDDLGNGRRFAVEHGRDLRYSPQLGAWLVYDGCRWSIDITGEHMRRAKSVVDDMLAEAFRLEDVARTALLKHVNRSSAAAKLRAMVEVAETEPGIPVTLDQLDTDLFLLNVRNGTLDLRTGELRPHDRADLITKIAPVAYDPEAPAPGWDRFVRDVFDGDDELVGFVQRFAGYSLTGDVSEQMLVFAHGSGANGKSTFLNALRYVTGDYGMHLDPRLLIEQQHEDHPTAVLDLLGMRLVTTIETEASRHLAEAKVKQLTGGDPIRARAMHKDNVEFRPTHKLWFAGNHLPRIRGTDHGIWRRIAVVPFEVTFAGDREDKSLSHKLEAERPGILAWMVRGCLEWQQTGLALPDRVRAATTSYRQSEDHLGRFLADCTVAGDHCSVSAAALREAYEGWCSGIGERPWSARAVGSELTARGFDSAQLGAARTRSWLGLGLLAEGEQALADVGGERL